MTVTRMLAAATYEAQRCQRKYRPAPVYCRNAMTRIMTLPATNTPAPWENQWETLSSPLLPVSTPRTAKNGDSAYRARNAPLIP